MENREVVRFSEPAAPQYKSGCCQSLKWKDFACLWLIFQAAGKASDSIKLNRTNDQWSNISTFISQFLPNSSHSCFSGIIAFWDGIPLPFLLFSLNSTSILGSQTCLPNLLYLPLLWLRCPPLSLVLPPHLSPFFGSELHSLTHPLPFLPAPSLLWWDPDVQLLWRTTAPQSLHGHPPFPVWALVPSDKPYNLHQNRNLKPVNRSWEDWTEP